MDTEGAAARFDVPKKPSIFENFRIRFRARSYEIFFWTIYISK